MNSQPAPSNPNPQTVHRFSKFWVSAAKTALKYLPAVLLAAAVLTFQLTKLVQAANGGPINLQLNSFFWDFTVTVGNQQATPTTTPVAIVTTGAATASPTATSEPPTVTPNPTPTFTPLATVTPMPTPTPRKIRTYVVRPGDTLQDIAFRTYGAKRYWKRIYLANLSQIDDPDLIFPGQELILPDGDEDNQDYGVVRGENHLELI